ncbi:AAA family ATPase [Vibrio diabolicus]|uniref:AAA family ATPase n=1 Tax=Vibrio diabolicus TaxID=50719 RepID=UPI0035A94FE7
MSKIKSIAIKDFRIYEGNEEFDFYNSDSVANLVALYAPNGYGKTSFFDAIEWAYSDKIGRLEQGIIKKEVKSDDFSIKDRIVLTNRNSYRKNKNVRGKVTINTEDGVLVKEVSTRKRNGVDTKDDYRAGNISGNYSKDQIRDLPTTNMLTHDQIDRFLRQETPEKKFAALQDFWPEGKKALLKYKKIKNLLYQIENKYSEISGSISSLQKRIDELSISDDDSIAIEQLVESINSRKYLPNKFDIVDKGLGKEQYDTFLFTSSLNKKKISESIEYNIKKRNKIVWLRDNYELYNKKTSEFSLLVNEVESLKRKQNLFKDLNKLQNEKILNQKLINELRKQQDDYKTIFNDIDDIVQSKKDIDKINVATTSYYNRLSSIHVNLSSYNKWIDKLGRYKSECHRKLDNLNKDIDLIEQNYLEFLKNKNEENILSKKSNQFDVDKNALLAEVKKLELIKINLDSIVKNKNWEHELLDEDFDFQKLRESLLDITAKCSRLSSDIDKRKNDFNTAGELSDNLDKIRGWGEKYIESTHHNHCPLCNTEFSKFEDLLSRIVDSKDDVLNISEQRNKIESLVIELDSINKDKIALEEKLCSIVQEKSESIGVELSKYNKELVSLNNERLELESSLLLIRSKVHERVSFFVLRGFNNDEINDESVGQFNNKVSLDIKGNEVKLERLNKILHALKRKLDSKYESKARYESLISSGENKKLMIKFNDNQKKSVELADKYNLEINEEIKSFLNTEISLTSDKLNDKNQEMVTYDEKISSINIQLDSENSEMTESIIIELLIEKEELKSNLDKYISDYLEKFRICDSEIEPNEESILLALRKEEEESEYLKESNHHLDVFETHIERAINQNLRSDFINKVELENERIKPVAISRERLHSLLDSCMKYMQEGIDSYFNKEVINKIYQRIEPHPSLKEINFIAEIGDSGPRLLISAKGDDEEVNPAIYLSAGQVNVLSLSIFLAKAFEHGSDSISTIFMDDPVHNLSDINILSFIDLLRSLTSIHDKQIVLSTHDEKFFKLMQSKLPEKYCNSKYLELVGEGKVKPPVKVG